MYFTCIVFTAKYVVFEHNILLKFVGYVQFKALFKAPYSELTVYEEKIKALLFFN